MPALQSGRVRDFAGGLAEAMEQALEEEWQALNGTPLPAEGRDDRRLLLVAVSRGLLRYLKAHEHEIFNSIAFEPSGTPTAVRGVDLNASES